MWWERMRSPQERGAGRMERLTLRGAGPGLRDRHPQGGTQRGAPPAVPLPPAPRRGGPPGRHVLGGPDGSTVRTDTWTWAALPAGRGRTPWLWPSAPDAAAPGRSRQGPGGGRPVVQVGALRQGVVRGGPCVETSRCRASGEEGAHIRDPPSHPAPGPSPGSWGSGGHTGTGPSGRPAWDRGPAPGCLPPGLTFPC